MAASWKKTSCVILKLPCCTHFHVIIWSRDSGGVALRVNFSENSRISLVFAASLKITGSNLLLRFMCTARTFAKKLQNVATRRRCKALCDVRKGSFFLTAVNLPFSFFFFLKQTEHTFSFDGKFSDSLETPVGTWDLERSTRTSSAVRRSTFTVSARRQHKNSAPRWNNVSPQIYEAGKGHESRPRRMEAAQEAREQLYGGCKNAVAEKNGKNRRTLQNQSSRQFWFVDW